MSKRTFGLAFFLMIQPLFSYCIATLAADAPIASGRSWYVAPTGDDGATGTLQKPFATVQRAQKAAGPGDTVFVRGGTYKMAEAQIAVTKGIFARITALDKSGEAGRPITYSAYANEKPLFDCSAVKPADKRVTAFYVSGSWIHLQGLEVTGVQVTIKEHTQSICFESQGSHNIFERLAMHDGQAIGIYHIRGSDNLFLNCDAWNNWDHTSENGKGGNVDGFGCHPSKGSTGNVLRGCRAWFNSDDGYDCINAHESVTFDHCWAAYNGLSPKLEKLADGNGFKAGGWGATPADELPNPIPRHTIRFCMAVGNKASGFYANHQPGGNDWINNTAYRNGANFNMRARTPDNRTDVDGYGHKLINNLSYGLKKEIVEMDASKCQLAGNSFTLGLKLTDKDFVSLDAAQLFQPRQPDGSLPLIDLLRPGSRSALVGGGVDNGLSKPGTKPDIGAMGK